MRPSRSSYVSILAWAVALSTLSILAGCSDPGVSEGEELASVSESAVIGSNDFVKVATGGTNVPEKYRASLNAFGRLHVDNSLCTATHIGNGIALTAGHCFDATADRETNTACSGNFVEWGYIAGGSASRSDCVSVLSKEKSGGNNALEYSIFRVSPVPPSSMPVNLKTKPGEGTTLTIFSNPEGRPLEWSKTCPLIDARATQLSHTCDTQGGSSGAAVLDDTTLEVIGVHWGGSGDENIATYLISTPLAEILAEEDPAPGGAGTAGSGGASGNGGAGGSTGGAGGTVGQGGSAGSSGGAAVEATGGSSGSGGASASASAGSSASSGASGASGASASAGQAGTSATPGATVPTTPETTGDWEGCGCRVTAPREAHWAAPWLGLIALTLLRRRRRRDD